MPGKVNDLLMRLVNEVNESVDYRSEYRINSKCDVTD